MRAVSVATITPSRSPPLTNASTPSLVNRTTSTSLCAAPECTSVSWFSPTTSAAGTDSRPSSRAAFQTTATTPSAGKRDYELERPERGRNPKRDERTAEQGEQRTIDRRERRGVAHTGEREHLVAPDVQRRAAVGVQVVLHAGPCVGDVLEDVVEA